MSTIDALASSTASVSSRAFGIAAEAQANSGRAGDRGDTPRWGRSSDSGLPVFRNHDCEGLPSPIIDWDGLRRSLRTECPHSRETKTLQCAARVRNWEDHVIPYLRLQQPEGRGGPLDFELFDRVETAAYQECPLGVLILNIARTLFCVRVRNPGCYLEHGTRVSRELFKTSVAVLIGTEWPVFALLNSGDWTWPGIPRGQDYDCTRHVNATTGMNWPAMRRAFIPDSPNEDASWWKTTIPYVYNWNLAASMYTASYECLYGVYVMNIVKTMWATDTESSAYKVYEPYVSWVLFESLHLLGATSWPMFALLHHFQSLRRHRFQLDYTARELADLPFREHGEWLQAQPLRHHLEALRSHTGLGWRPQLAEATSALLNALGRVGDTGLRLVYVTMVYGGFNRFIAGWAARLRKLGVENLVMATLDDEAYSLCGQFYDQQRCVRGSISVLNKYTLLLIALQMGIDVMWLDFDIFLVRHPDAAVAKALSAGGSSTYDALIGYAFESDCICNGFFFLRALPNVHFWLLELVRWLYDHPFEHDQRAISAFLNYTEKISAKHEDLPPPPHWHVFDVHNEFINFGAWEGRYEDLVLVHFMDGSAFSLYGRPGDWDPSVLWRKNVQPEAMAAAEGAPEAAASGRLEPHRGVGAEAASEAAPTGGRWQGGPVGVGEPMPRPTSAMEAFYQAHAIAASPEGGGVALAAAAPELRQLLDAQIRPRTQQRQSCGILPGVGTAHSGYGWLVDSEGRYRF